VRIVGCVSERDWSAALDGLIEAVAIAVDRTTRARLRPVRGTCTTARAARPARRSFVRPQASTSSGRRPRRRSAASP